MPGPDTAKSRSLHLVIPGLFGPFTEPDTGSPELPALELLLARADRSRPVRTDSFEAGLFALFGMESCDGGDLPVAAVTRVMDMGIVDQGWWLRADPVHLHPERDRLILSDSQQLQLSQEEADRLVAEIMVVFAEDGWILKAARPDRWYLKPRKAPKIKTTPLPQVIGRDIHPYLPAGEDGKSWHTIMNEVQILLHTADVNVAREERGELPVNSLWFWGGGTLPPHRQHDWNQVWSDEPVSAALARLTSTQRAPAPPDASSWLAQTETGDHLVVLSQGRVLMQYSDVDGWRIFAEALEQEWFAPLLEAVRRGDLAAVVLHDDCGERYRLDRRGLRRWWRRRRRLHRYRPSCDTVRP